jgi:hypothetical protein
MVLITSACQVAQAPVAEDRAIADQVGAPSEDVQPTPDAGLYPVDERDTAEEVSTDRVITSSDLISPGAGAYASLSVGGWKLLVQNERSIVPQGDLDDADLVLDAGSRDLLDLQVVVTPTDQAATVALIDTVSYAQLAFGDFRLLPRSLAGVALPPDMPSFSLPDVRYCSASEELLAQQAYVRAAIQVWWLRSLLDRWNERPTWQQEKFWEATMKGARGQDLGELSSMTRFFSQYADFRLDAVRDALTKVWNIFLTRKTGGIGLRLHCPYSNANACSTSTRDPSAHHIVKGRIDLCDPFFGRDQGPYEQALTVAHELFHHIWVSWKDTIHRSDPIQDTHAHWEGSLCGKSRGSHVIYHRDGEDQKDTIEHFAKYWKKSGPDCYHSNILFRTNNAYAFALTHIAGGWYEGARDWPGKDYWDPRRP